jgi:uncharacterized protein YecE (DUF72 family)
VELRTGTSGFSYKEWKGSFYPDDLAADGMLAYYAGRLGAVEINNTFYRMPRAETLAAWRAEVPERFRFAIKAPQRITHRARLVDCQDSVDLLWHACAALGDQLGPLLFQLPPFLRLDLQRLRAFLAGLPVGCRAAFEFRHPSWQVPEVHAALAEARAALCVADVDGAEPPELVATADWGYLRLRREGYAAEELDRWATRLLRVPQWREAFVFFKHEDGAAGPRLAREFAERFAAG